MKIVSGGRGRLMAAAKIVDKIISLTGKTTPNVLYLGTPTFDADEPFHLQTDGLSRAGCPIDRLDISERPRSKIDILGGDVIVPSHEEMRERITNADVIIVSGGNTLYSVDRWNKLGISDMIREAIGRQDGEGAPVLCGGSAGAICWFESGHSDSMDPTTFLNPTPNLSKEELVDWEYIKVPGLNLIPALCVPHHDAVQSNGVRRSTDSDAMVKQRLNYPCIGIDEEAAFVVNGDLFSVVSTGVASKCYLKIWRGEKGGLDVRCLQESDGETPLSELGLNVAKCN